MRDCLSKPLLLNLKARRVSILKTSEDYYNKVPQVNPLSFPQVLISQQTATWKSVPYWMNPKNQFHERSEVPSKLLVTIKSQSIVRGGEESEGSERG